MSGTRRLNATVGLKWLAYKCAPLRVHLCSIPEVTKPVTSLVDKREQRYESKPRTPTWTEFDHAAHRCGLCSLDAYEMVVKRGTGCNMFDAFKIHKNLGVGFQRRCTQSLMREFRLSGPSPGQICISVCVYLSIDISMYIYIYRCV